MSYWALQMRDLGLHTELLESFDWDEEALASAIKTVEDTINSLPIGPPDVFLPLVRADLIKHFNTLQVKIFEKIIRIEMEKFVKILKAPEA